VFLRQAQDRLTLRLTIQVRLGFDLGFRISDLGFLTTIDDIELYSSDFTICSLVLTSLRANFQSAFRNRRSGGLPAIARLRRTQAWQAGTPIVVVW
jgi:hypothetical protein